MDLKSGYPFWPVNDGLIHTYPRLPADLRCDVAIIGAGITGALVAHHLAMAGIDTIVLDRRDVGWGSTAASTALLQYEIDVSLTELTTLYGRTDAARAYVACRDAIGKLEQLANTVSSAVGFERKKSLYLASRPRDRLALRAEFDQRRALGFDIDWLDEADLAASFSFRRPAALLSRDAAQVDAYAFTHALLHDAVARGTRVFDRTTIDRVDSGRQCVRLVTADGCVVTARRVVFAVGYEANEFLENDVAKLVSTYAFASEPLSALEGWGEDACIIWEHARPYLYLRTTSDRRVIVGGEDEPFRDPAHRDSLLADKTATLADRFRELFPDISIEVAFAWAGTFGETRDGLGYIGEHRDWPHAYFALCYGGNGITFGLLAAEIIRDAVLGRPNENASLFRFGR